MSCGIRGCWVGWNGGREERVKCDEMKKEKMVAVPLLERKQVTQCEGIK